MKRPYAAPAATLVLLASLALTGYALYDTMNGTVTDVNAVPVWPAFFLGGLGLLARQRR